MSSSTDGSLASLEQLRAELRALAQKHLEENERLIARFQPELGSSQFPVDGEGGALPSRPRLQTEACHGAMEPSRHRLTFMEGHAGHGLGAAMHLPSLVSSAIGSATAVRFEAGDPSHRGHSVHSVEAVESRRKSIAAPQAQRSDALRRAITRQIETNKGSRNEQAKHMIRKAPCIGWILAALYDWWNNLKEPPRTSCLGRVVTHSAFTAASFIAILANTVVIVVDSNRLLKDPYAPDDSTWVAIRLAFTVFYTVELVLKLLVHRLYFFVNQEGHWNSFDFILVTMSYLEFFFNPSFLRLVRVVKIGRIVRMLQFASLFDDLRTIILSLTACMTTMLWSGILLAFLLCLFSIFFVQTGVGYAADEGDNLSPLWWEEFNVYFGGVATGMLSLLAVTNGGEDWLVVYNLVKSPGTVNSMVFTFFVVFFQLAVYNIVMSSFLDRAMKSTIPSMEERLEKRLAEDEQFSSTLFDMMTDLDVDDDGTVSEKEFEDAMLEGGKVYAFLKLHGLDIKDSQTFFKMLSKTKDVDDSSDELKMDYVDFVQACCRLRGEASTLDVSLVSFDIKIMHQRHDRMMRKLQQQAVEITSLKRCLAGSSDPLALGRGAPHPETGALDSNAHAARDTASSVAGSHGHNAPPKLSGKSQEEEKLDKFLAGGVESPPARMKKMFSDDTLSSSASGDPKDTLRSAAHAAHISAGGDRDGANQQDASEEMQGAARPQKWKASTFASETSAIVVGAGSASQKKWKGAKVAKPRAKDKATE
eukprot:gb/GFBE01016038.1/.p1 GENE.gb/GFBE01016038.1/~~gb/GFBE01016038.1/.p1  ORF type:complete len:759 (+),score=135.23 gb/GFBE01016038.1/:1-2277(+)